MSPARRSWGKNPVQGLVLWVKRQPMQRKTLLGVLAGIVTLFFLRIAVRDHDNLFVASEIIHAVGILVLIYKLSKERNCAGLSLKTQELTAIFLGVRLWCSLMMEYNAHTILDTATLAVTLWVVYTIRFKLKAASDQSKDNLPIHYVLVPCAILAVLVHPKTSHHVINRILWAFCVYLESVSVLPQLRVMQLKLAAHLFLLEAQATGGLLNSINTLFGLLGILLASILRGGLLFLRSALLVTNTKLVEPFTAHYVFALGIARFLSCAHWVLQVIDRGSILFGMLGYSGMWAPMVLLSEVVQTFILADFCYYYVKSAMEGQLMVRLPSGVV